VCHVRVSLEQNRDAALNGLEIGSCGKSRALFQFPVREIEQVGCRRYGFDDKEGSHDINELMTKMAHIVAAVFHLPDNPDK